MARYVIPKSGCVAEVTWNTKDDWLISNQETVMRPFVRRQCHTLSSSASHARAKLAAYSLHTFHVKGLPPLR